MNSLMLLGKWALIDSITSRTLSYNFIDDRNVVVSLEENKCAANYLINNHENKTIISIKPGSGKVQELVILEYTADKIKLCFSKDYERVILGKQFNREAVSWGWNNPIMILQKQSSG